MKEFGPESSQSAESGQVEAAQVVLDLDAASDPATQEITDGMSLDEIIALDKPNIIRCNDQQYEC